MKYHITMRSRNEKTGPIPVSTTSSESCPDVCPLKNGPCYAKAGPLGMHWKQVDGNRGTSLRALCDAIESMPAGQLWRHNQAGDLPGVNNRINARDLNKIVKANNSRRGFTFSHKPDTTHNIRVIKDANARGFTVNLSGNNVSHAIKLARHGLPVVTLLPIDAPKYQTVQGHKVVTCPATYRDTSCAKCGMCQKPDRGYIIGFPAHGASKRKANVIATS